MALVYTFYVLLAAAVVFLVFYSSIHKTVKATTLTLLVVFGLAVADHYNKHIGSPIQGLPEYEFTYVHHEATGDTIKLWVWSKEMGDRLYVFPYDQDTAQELSKAQEKTKNGRPQQGGFTPEEDGDRYNPGLELDGWVGDNTTETKEV